MKSYTCLVVAACAGTTAEAACVTEIPVGHYVSVAGSADDCVNSTITFANFLVAADGEYYNVAGTVGTVSATGGTTGTPNTVATCATTAPTGKFLSGACVVNSVLVAGSDTAFTAFTTAVPANNYASADGTATADVTFTPFTNTVPANHFAATSGIAGTVAADGTVTGAADVSFTAFTTTGWAGKWATTAGDAGSVTAAGVVTPGTDIVYTAFVAGPPAGHFAAAAGVPGKAYADGTISTGGASGIAAGAATVFAPFTTTRAGYYATAAGIPGVAAADGTLTTQGVDVGFSMCHTLQTQAAGGDGTAEQTETKACAPGTVAADGTITTAGTDQSWTGCADVVATKYTGSTGSGFQCATRQATTYDCTTSVANHFRSSPCVPGSGMVPGRDAIFTPFTGVNMVVDRERDDRLADWQKDNDAYPTYIEFNTMPVNHYASAAGTAVSDVAFTPFTTGGPNFDTRWPDWQGYGTIPVGYYATHSADYSQGHVNADGTIRPGKDVGLEHFATMVPAGKYIKSGGSAGYWVYSSGAGGTSAERSRTHSRYRCQEPGDNFDPTKCPAPGLWSRFDCYGDQSNCPARTQKGSDITFTDAPAVPAGWYNSVAMDPGHISGTGWSVGLFEFNGHADRGYAATASLCTAAVPDGMYALTSCVAENPGADGTVVPGTIGTDTEFGHFTTVSPWWRSPSYATASGAAGTATAGTAAGGMDVAYSPCTVGIPGEQTFATACAWGSVTAAGALTVAGTDTVFTGCTQPAAGKRTARIGAGVDCVTMQPTFADCTAVADGDYAMTACNGGSGLVLGTDTVSMTFNTVPAGSYNSVAGSVGSATVTGLANTVTACSAPPALGSYVSTACAAGTAGTTAGTNTVITAFTRAVAGHFASGRGVAGNTSAAGSDVNFTICTVATASQDCVYHHDDRYGTVLKQQCNNVIDTPCVAGTVAADGTISAGSDTTFAISDFDPCPYEFERATIADDGSTICEWIPRHYQLPTTGNHKMAVIVGVGGGVVFLAILAKCWHKFKYKPASAAAPDTAVPVQLELAKSASVPDVTV